MSGTTIAALATAPGRGGVAVVRVSGPDAFLVAGRLTGWRATEAVTFPCCRTLVVHSPATTSARQQALDRALVLAFRAPHSYTGEDVVEFQCHGGTVTPARVLAACFAAGATAARRGEFTERAFLSGKMDLSEAESVIELVDAKTARAADDALARQAGAKARAYRALYEKALALSAEFEHALDVDEDELPADFLSSRAARAAALGEEARRLAGSADAGRLLRDGALVVLAGAPNAGKSSLLNALCGEDRAIVSPTPGTTRDTIEAWVDLEGWPVRLVDTAGLRETGDAVEAEGVRRAEALLEKADVILALDCEIEGALRLHAKCDLDSCCRTHVVSGATTTSVRQQGPTTSVRQQGPTGVRQQGPTTSARQQGPTGVRQQGPTGVRQQGLRVSAKTGEGLDELRAAIAARLAARAGSAAEDGATASERERAILLAAARQLEGERQEIRDESGDDRHKTNPDARLASLALDPVLLANAVRAAASTLGQLIGATYSSDLLDSLFSRFCVGK